MKMIRRFLLLSLVFAIACTTNGADKPSAAPDELMVQAVDPNSLTTRPSLLGNNQQDAVNMAAQNLLASNELQAIRVARTLHFEGGSEDPSNMCGPLALSILQKSGIVSSTMPLRSFWLLNPRINRKVINEAFPPNQFFDWRFRIPINKFDFKKFPLQTGDFLYIYAGRGGSFEHMLVVTRVDAAGRAFSITNFDVALRSYVIQEVMLYDPSAPGKGKFYDWTNFKNWRLGLTGFGGFELWRRSAPIAVR